MLRSPRYQASATPPTVPVRSEFSEFWTVSGCADIPQTAIRNPKDGFVAGFIPVYPGKLWKHMTGHLQKLQSPISKSYFDNIEYVKVPAFWSGIMNPNQRQHALASVTGSLECACGGVLSNSFSVAGCWRRRSLGLQSSSRWDNHRATALVLTLEVHVAC